MTIMACTRRPSTPREEHLPANPARTEPAVCARTSMLAGPTLRGAKSAVGACPGHGGPAVAGAVTMSRKARVAGEGAVALVAAMMRT